MRLRDALHTIALQPWRYAAHVLDAVDVWLKPSFQGLAGTRNTVVMGFARSPFSTEAGAGFLFWLYRGFAVLCYVVALVYGGAVSMRLLHGSDADPGQATVVFMWLTVVYAMVVVNLTEIWENNRIRFMTDPYAWLLVGAALTRCIGLIRSIYGQGAKS